MKSLDDIIFPCLIQCILCAHNNTSSCWLCLLYALCTTRPTKWHFFLLNSVWNLFWSETVGKSTSSCWLCWLSALTLSAFGNCVSKSDSLLLCCVESVLLCCLSAVLISPREIFFFLFPLFWSGARDCDIIQTLFSIYFFSVCSKPKKDGDFSWIS